MSYVSVAKPQFLAATSLAAGEPRARTASLGAGTALFMEGDRSDRIYELVSGIVRLSKMLPDGRRQILGFVFAGEVFTSSGFALYHGGKANCTADAVAEIRIVSHRASSIERILDGRPELTRELLAATGRSLLRAQQQMLLLGRMCAAERLVWFLLNMAEQQQLAGNATLHLPISRLDIADYLGMTVETVSRTFRWLREQKLIATVGATEIRIVDPARMHQIAGGAPAHPAAAAPAAQAAAPVTEAPPGHSGGRGRAVRQVAEDKSGTRGAQWRHCMNDRS